MFLIKKKKKLFAVSAQNFSPSDEDEDVNVASLI